MPLGGGVATSLGKLGEKVTDLYLLCYSSFLRLQFQSLPGMVVHRSSRYLSCVLYSTCPVCAAFCKVLCPPLLSLFSSCYGSFLIYKTVEIQLALPPDQAVHGPDVVITTLFVFQNQGQGKLNTAGETTRPVCISHLYLPLHQLVSVVCLPLFFVVFCRSLWFQSFYRQQYVIITSNVF